MIITATPQPENFPPRIRLDIYSEGDEFLELTVLRDGRPIRQQPAVNGLSETFVYDYEAPFGVPVTYSAEAAISSGAWPTVLSEAWANLDGWTVASGSPSVSGGRFRSDMGSSSVRRDLLLGAGAFRVRLPNADVLTPSGGQARIDVGGIIVYRIIQSSGTPSLRLVSGTSEAVIPVSTGPVDLLVDARRSTASLAQGANRVSLPIKKALTSTVTVSGSLLGSVGAFTVEVAPTPVRASADTSTQLDISEAWLIHPIQPSLSIPIERFSHGGEMSVAASTDETRTYASRQAIYQPNGRREAVSYPLGPRGAGAWTLELTLENIEARNDLMTLLDDQAPVLLRSPSEADWDLPDGWYSVGDVSVSRPINIGGVELRRATLPLTKVAEPPVKIAPQLTWGDLMLRGVKWGDLLSKTWLQALMGEV